MTENQDPRAMEAKARKTRRGAGVGVGMVPTSVDYQGESADSLVIEEATRLGGSLLTYRLTDIPIPSPSPRGDGPAKSLILVEVSPTSSGRVLVKAWTMDKPKTYDQEPASLARALRVVCGLVHEIRKAAKKKARAAKKEAKAIKIIQEIAQQRPGFTHHGDRTLVYKTGDPKKFGPGDREVTADVEGARVSVTAGTRYGQPGTSGGTRYFRSAAHAIRQIDADLIDADPID